MIAIVARAVDAVAILSSDTDMLIYDTGKTGLIPLWGFGFAEDGGFHAFQLQRSKLAAILGISVANLPLLSALVGNDYSSPEVLDDIHKQLLNKKWTEVIRKATMENDSERSCEFDDLDKVLTEVLEGVEDGVENVDCVNIDDDNRNGDTTTTADVMGDSRKRKSVNASSLSNNNCDPKNNHGAGKRQSSSGNQSKGSAAERMKERKRANKLEEKKSRERNHQQKTLDYEASRMILDSEAEGFNLNECGRSMVDGCWLDRLDEVTGVVLYQYLPPRTVKLPAAVASALSGAADASGKSVFRESAVKTIYAAAEFIKAVDQHNQRGNYQQW
jgi:hypothetical protein